MSKTKDPAVAIALRLSLPAWQRLKARADAQGISVGLAAKAVLEREFGEPPVLSENQQPEPPAAGEGERA